MRHQPIQETLQIIHHLRIRVLHDHQRRRGVLHMQRQQPLGNLRASDPLTDLRSELMRPHAARGDNKFVELLLHDDSYRAPASTFVH